LLALGAGTGSQKEEKVPLTIDELLNREMIRDLLADYTVAGELGQGVSPVIDAFHPEGTLELSDGSLLHGQAEIEALFTRISTERLARGGPGAYTRHCIYTCRFDFPSATVANTVSYMLAFSECGLDQVVTYYDALVKQDDRWYLWHRRVGMEYLAANSRLTLPTMVVRARQLQVAVQVLPATCSLLEAPANVIGD
jgi:hypothetical protein